MQIFWVVMYCAYCLGEIGDALVLPSLKKTCEKFKSKKRKSTDDYAVISATYLASEKVKREGASRNDRFYF